MATPEEKLADSLQVLRQLQIDDGSVAIRSKDLSRTHRERLQENGFIRRVMKGWYIPIRPDEKPGESTSWYASFWRFCSRYLNERFGRKWCISPEQSLSYHVGNRTIPEQLIVRSPKARNKVTRLLHDTSLLDLKAELPPDNELEIIDGLNLFSVASALVACNPRFFVQNPVDARAALGMIRDSSEVLRLLLEDGHSTIAGRLAGAFRNTGKDRVADELLKTMRAAGYEVREKDPFEKQITSLSSKPDISPYVYRIQLMWEQMRETVLAHFPEPPGLPDDMETYLKQVEDIYVTDAYHSLSIEGYRVSPELIERVRSGDWNPEVNKEDREHRDAMAARGYWQAFQSVKGSIKKVLNGKNPGKTADDDHGEWYRQLFAPGVTAGIIKPADLAGYRNGQVYIKQSMHVPPNHRIVRELVPALFEKLKDEEVPAIRAVLGHFLFVYIHPYMDGNGRMARFLMNLMLASGGYPWTVIPVEERNAYMKALEQASVEQDIEAFSVFIAHLVEEGLKGRPLAKI